MFKHLRACGFRAFVLPFSCSYLILRLGVPSREASLALENSKGGSQRRGSSKCWLWLCSNKTFFFDDPIQFSRKD